MTHADAGHYARKHGPDAVADPVIREALLKRAVAGKLPCAVAFEVVKRLNVSPAAVGRTADLMELRLVKCQLGLFGHARPKGIAEPAASVTLLLEKAIRQALVNDRLPCEIAWKIAETFRIHKREVGAACDALGIKIRPCQLGAF